MRRYINLTNILREGEAIRTLSFDEIDRIVGEPMAPVYYRGNTLKHSNSRYQMSANRAGFVLDSFDFNQRTMTFRRMTEQEQSLMAQAPQRRQTQHRRPEVNLNDDLGRDLDSAITVFKNSWGSVGGEYVPFLNKYNNINDVYFNAGMEAYRAAMKRAIHFYGLPQRERSALREQSCRYLAEAFANLFNLNNMDFDIFTDWANNTATYIRSIYRNAGVNDYTYGNAQKLINVALKFVMSSNIVNYHHRVFQYCHFPVDGIIQKIIRRRFGARQLNTCWSKNDDWDEFVEYQRCVRTEVLNEGYYSPMVWEATHWNIN